MSSATRAGSFRRRRCETLPPDRGVLQRGPRPRCSPHSHHRRRAPRNPPRVDLHNGGRPAGHNLTAFGLAVEIGDWRRFMGNSISVVRRVGAHRVLLGQFPSARLDHQDRPRSRPAAAGLSSLLGTIGPPTGQAWACGPAGSWHRRPREPVATKATADSTAGGSGSSNARSGTPSRPPQSPVSSPAGASRWPSSTTCSRRPQTASQGTDPVAARVLTVVPTSRHALHPSGGQGRHEATTHYGDGGGRARNRAWSCSGRSDRWQ